MKKSLRFLSLLLLTVLLMMTPAMAKYVQKQTIIIEVNIQATSGDESIRIIDEITGDEPDRTNSEEESVRDEEPEDKHEAEQEPDIDTEVPESETEALEPETKDLESETEALESEKANSEPEMAVPDPETGGAGTEEEELPEAEEYSPPYEFDDDVYIA